MVAGLRSQASDALRNLEIHIQRADSVGQNGMLSQRWSFCVCKLRLENSNVPTIPPVNSIRLSNHKSIMSMSSRDMCSSELVR